jgi:hypothetical protein
MAEPFDEALNEEVQVQNGTAEAVVQFGDVSIDSADALYEVDDTGIWTDYYVVNHYEKDKQIWMLPVTSPSGFDGDSVSFVQLASQTLLLICDWTAEKTGEAPTIPSEEPSDDNMVLLDAHKEPGMKELGAGGAEEDIIYRLSGTYIYGFKNPDLASMCFPQPPWMQQGAGECDISESIEQEGIMCCESGSSDSSEASPGDAGSQNSPALSDEGLESRGGDFSQS